MSRPGGTVARGYGPDHQARRRALKPMVDAGAAVCARCGREILPGSPWDLDHAEDRVSYRGPAHRSCNRAAGARKANARRAARAARRPRVPGGVFGPLSQ